MEAVNPGRDRVINLTVACGVLATVAVILRLVARWKSKASIAADDWWMVACLIPSYGMLAVGTILITSGRGGQRADTLTESQMVTFLKTLSASIITYALTITMVKISILLLYRRIFTTIHFKRATLIVGLACISWLIASLLCLAFQCHTNAERYNADSLFSDQCIDLKAYWVATTGSNMALDLFILCMPLYMVWNLKLAARQKIALSGVFALGALVFVASLMRIITIDLVKGADLTYTIITPYMWSQIEPTMAIVCACLTTLRPLFTNINLTFLSFVSRTSQNTASSSSPKSKRLWSHLKDDTVNAQKKGKWMRSLLERRKDDTKTQKLEVPAYTGAQGAIMKMVSLEDSTSETSSVPEGSMV